jgi:hypothetical protein
MQLLDRTSYIPLCKCLKCKHYIHTNLQLSYSCINNDINISHYVGLESRACWYAFQVELFIELTSTFVPTRIYPNRREIYLNDFCKSVKLSFDPGVISVFDAKSFYCSSVR